MAFTGVAKPCTAKNHSVSYPINFSDPSGLMPDDVGIYVPENDPGAAWEAARREAEADGRRAGLRAAGAAGMWPATVGDVIIGSVLGESIDPTVPIILRRPTSSCDKQAASTSPHKTDSILIRDGKVVQRVEATSGGMTPEQKAMGFPKGMLDSHTEPKTLRAMNLEPGDTLVIKGTNSPCPSCRGAMNSAAREFKASIYYVWGEQYWTAGQGMGQAGQR